MGTVSHNVTTKEDFEPTVTGTIGTDGGAGPGAGANPGLQYEGAESLIRRIQSTGSLSGYTYILPATPGPFSFLAATSTIWWVKVFTALSAEIEAPGTRVHVGDTVTDMYAYQVGDDGTMGAGKFALPPKGGYVILPIEVRLNAWRNLPDRGTNPDPVICDVFGVQHQVTNATGAGSTQSLDAIHVSDDGLYVVGSASVFNDYLAADEGEGIAGTERVGMWTSQEGVLFVYGPHVIGRTDAGVVTSTQFADSLQTIVFPGGFVGTGFNEFECDLGNAGTTVDWTNITIIGQGRQRKKVYFDTELDVDGGAAEDIDIIAHGFEDGDQVAYSAEGGTEDIGPDAATGEADNSATAGRGAGDNWYVIEGSTANILHLSATADDALGAQTSEDLTASTAGNGERHSLERQPITVPNITFVGTAGAATLLNCTIVNFNAFVGTSVVVVTGGTYVSGVSWDLADMEVDGATFITPNVQYGEAFMEGIPAHFDSATRGMKNCAFSSGGQGHAIHITGTAANIAYTGNTHAGYSNWDEDNTGGISFNTFTDVIGGATDTITMTLHGISTGEAVFYSDEGGTDAIGLTDNAMYFVRAVDANTVAFYLTERAATDDANRINLTAGLTPGETQKIYSANAAVWNDTGGAINLNIGGGGDGPSVRNTSGSTTTVVNTVTITITVVDEAGDPIETAQVWTAEGTDRDNPGTVLDNGDTNASGVRSFSFEFSTDQPILISIRKSSTGTNRYVPVETSGTIDSGGFALRRTLALDTIVEA